MSNSMLVFPDIITLISVGSSSTISEFVKSFKLIPALSIKPLNVKVSTIPKINNKIEKNNEKEIKMIDKVMLLLSELGMQVDKFTSEESKDERKYLIEKLTEGYIDGLVAIRCLDEGVDIPSVERAFILSSSSNPKEFVQRRGRVLRQSRATGKKYAYIYDFIVLPDLKKQSYYSVSANFERKYIEKELTRFQEFAELALNAHEVEPKILEIKKYYRLLHI